VDRGSISTTASHHAGTRTVHSAGPDACPGEGRYFCYRSAVERKIVPRHRPSRKSFEVSAALGLQPAAHAHVGGQVRVRARDCWGKPMRPTRTLFGISRLAG
jgi:hypothetical protein